MSGRARLVDVVPLRELMGGSLAGIPSQEASRVGCCGGLVDILLGPEGTRCVRVFLGTTWTWPAGRWSAYVLPIFLGCVCAGCQREWWGVCVV